MGVFLLFQLQVQTMNEVMITLSTVGVSVLCIVLGIISLSIFYGLWSWISANKSGVSHLAIDEFLDEDDLVTVHFYGGECLENIRLYEFTKGENHYVPNELGDMILIRDNDNRKLIVRARSIRMITVNPQSQADDFSSKYR